MKFRLNFALILCAIDCIAQKSDSTIHLLSVKTQYATIWTNRTSLQQFTRNHPQSFQIDFGSIANTKKSWNYCNCYSQNGLSIAYIDFNNSKLGRAFTVSGFAEPYLFTSSKFQLSLRGSAGLAFVNKIYDSIANKDNIFFSTKTSFYLGLGFNSYVRIGNHLKTTLSVQFNHISNGGRRDPNEGMNFPAASIGLTYEVKPTHLPKRRKEKFMDKSVGIILHAFGTQRAAQPTAGLPEEKRWVIGMNAGLIKRLGRINGIGAGGEFYYDGINSIYQQRTNQQIQTGTGALNIQHYLFFGKLLFGQQAAWFITPNTGYQKIFYQRYFLEYEARKNWYMGVSLKAHGDHSDFLAFSTGYFFRL